ncbi:hypothetical protein BWQ96_06313 [Gracilariopsis chorda]|uniref:Uncharacterized protein n=1 Tax=Gracilariopsis chorda TaxID=448386 RepID=A0A2V3IPF2_9FLOR|nr:hypothetical protein BWQ96_06313 [Gracilariopsis chorda]|eukprot:PXF43944.1 hypothetical protein BWQ96_06313 [Gracilariopsis chorda]
MGNRQTILNDSDEEDIAPLRCAPKSTDHSKQDSVEGTKFQELHLKIIEQRIAFVYENFSTRTSKASQVLLHTERRNTSGSKQLPVGRMMLHVYTGLQRTLKLVSLMMSLDKIECRKFMDLQGSKPLKKPPPLHESLDLIPSAAEKLTFTRATPFRILQHSSRFHTQSQGEVR